MTDLALNPVDLAALAIVLLSAALAFFRGFVHEVLAIGAWVGAALAALYGLPLVAPVVADLVPSLDWAAQAIAGVGLFLVGLVILSMISHSLSRQVRKTALNALDRSLGFVFGLARGVVILVALFLVVTWFTPRESLPAWVTEARSLPLIERGAGVALALMPPALGGSGPRGATAGPGGGGPGAGRGETTAPPSAPAETLTPTAPAPIDPADRVRRLADPRPEAPPPSREAPPGYDDSARQQLNRLIESTR